MEIRQLKHLLTVARTGSFSRSAEELHLTQSALSRSIQSLEDEMGGPLLDRQSRHCQPTPLGETVLAHARRVPREGEALKTGTKDSPQGRAGAPSERKRSAGKRWPGSQAPCPLNAGRGAVNRTLSMHDTRRTHLHQGTHAR